jgi:exo-beta-1,3-glucanase (GH17 family)
MIRSRLLKVLAIALALLVIAISYSARQESRRARQLRVVDLAKYRWIGYAPTHYDPRRAIFPDVESIRADLTTLKAAGFDGVITYESGGRLEQVPLVASELGLLVIQGVWAPVDRDELDVAIGLKNVVAGYCVGNEGLGSRYTLAELDQGTTYLANHVDLPVAVSEQVHVYFEHPELLDLGDWMFPIVHPHFGGAKGVADALGWVEANTARLKMLAAARGSQQPLFIKEIGMPSEGDPRYSELEQAQFFELLWQQKGLAFSAFEAFDRRGWQYVSPVEPFWGLFRHDRTPKLVVQRFIAVTNGPNIGR